MPDTVIRISPRPPDWAVPWLKALIKREAEGEEVDIVSVRKLIAAFTTYQVT